MQYEDSVRNAYISTFKTEKDGIGLSGPNLTEEQAGYFLKKSEGNYVNITNIIRKFKDSPDVPLFDLLNSLSEKDLRDVDYDIIQLGHITSYDPKCGYPYDVYLKGIISPRISNERISCWRGGIPTPFLPDNFFQKEPPTAHDILQWIQENIVVDDAGNYFNCPISPIGAYQLRRADRHSRDIMFVATCRYFDIPAYLDNATGQKYVWEKNQWIPIDFPDQQKNENAVFQKLTIDYQGDKDTKPTYWTHYTLARFENGDFVTYDYEDDPRVANFPFTLEVEPGYYMLSTGVRNSEGTVLSRLEFFNIPADKAVSKTVILRISEDEMILFPDPLYPATSVVCFIDPTREPTKHLLKEIAQLKSEFESWGGTLVFVVPSDKLAPDFHFYELQLPKQSILVENMQVEGTEKPWFDCFIQATGQDFRDNLPTVFVVTADGTITFRSEGYSIGTGNLILQSAR